MCVVIGFIATVPWMILRLPSRTSLSVTDRARPPPAEPPMTKKAVGSPFNFVALLYACSDVT